MGRNVQPDYPVFEVPPAEWEPDNVEAVRAAGIAKGYIDFFEPDVFVQFEEGLAEKAGAAPTQGHQLKELRTVPTYIPNLDDFMVAHGYQDIAVPYFGLRVAPLLAHLYEREQRFELRKDVKSVLVQPQSANALIEALFGVYPERFDAEYIANGYGDVFSPENMGENADAWVAVYRDGARTPLRLTAEYISSRRHWGDKILVYVFDQTRPTDLIDLWNIRLEHRPLLPVPLDWLDFLSGYVPEIVNSLHVIPPGSTSPSARKLAREIDVETSRSIHRSRALTK